jgi:hypothetical protein
MTIRLRGYDKARCSVKKQGVHNKIQMVLKKIR